MNEPSSVSFADTFPRRGKARLEGKVGRQDMKARQEDTKIGIEIKIQIKTQRDINAGFKCF